MPVVHEGRVNEGRQGPSSPDVSDTVTWEVVVGPTDGGNLVVELAVPLPACRVFEVTLNGCRPHGSNALLGQAY